MKSKIISFTIITISPMLQKVCNFWESNDSVTILRFHYICSAYESNSLSFTTSVGSAVGVLPPEPDRMLCALLCCCGFFFPTNLKSLKIHFWLLLLFVLAAIYTNTQPSLSSSSSTPSPTDNRFYLSSTLWAADIAWAKHTTQPAV